MLFSFFNTSAFGLIQRPTDSSGTFLQDGLRQLFMSMWFRTVVQLRVLFGSSVTFCLLFQFLFKVTLLTKGQETSVTWRMLLICEPSRLLYSNHSSKPFSVGTIIVMPSVRSVLEIALTFPSISSCFFRASYLFLKSLFK